MKPDEAIEVLTTWLQEHRRDERFDEAIALSIESLRITMGEQLKLAMRQHKPKHLSKRARRALMMGAVAEATGMTKILSQLNVHPY